MEKLFTLVIFAVIGGLWVVLQAVSKAQARKAAREHYDRQGFDEDFNLEPDEQAYEFEEAPQEQPRPQPVRAPAPRPKAVAAAPAPAPKRHLPKARRGRSSYGRFIKTNAQKAIMMQEILGPPKGLQ